MPRDPFTAYFTPERLERLEDLRERFPHWCIDWPKVAAFRAPTTSVRRLTSAIQEMREDLKRWEETPELPDDEQVEAWADEVTGRVFRIDSGDENTQDQAEIDAPAIHVALFKCIALTLNANPERGLVIGHWLRRLHHILVQDDPTSAETRVRLARLAGKAWVVSAEAARSGNQMRQTKAENAREQLSQYWRLIGEQIGLIPPSQRGGLADLIPDEWLSEFAQQARALLKKVRAYKPDSNAQGAVRALLLAEPYPAGSGHNLMIAQEHARHGKAYPDWDKQVKLDDWCLRLAFPMLTRGELADAQSKRGWRWLLANRLDMTSNVLSKRLSQHRHPS